MARLMSLALLVAVALALFIPSVASATAPQLHMLRKINKIRANHNLPKLRHSESLQGSATRYSRYMERRDYFGHSSRIRASGKYRSLGEILEAHFVRKPMIAYAARSWMNSSSHRSVILSRSYRVAGAGFAMGRYQGKPVTMWTMHFGRK